MYVIAGIDPGTTTGIAVLDFRGNVLFLHSSKDLGVEGAIASILPYGKPSVIAADVSHVPSFLSKIAASFGAVVYTPKESLKVGEKILLTKDHPTQDAHQRDALAAALNCFSSYRNLLERIDLRGLGDGVKDLVLKGDSIDSAQRRLESPPEEKPAERLRPEPKEITREQKEIRMLRRQIRALKGLISEKNSAVRAAREELYSERRKHALDLERSTQIRERDRQIRDLSRKLMKGRRKTDELDHLKRLWHGIASGELQPVGVFPRNYSGFTLVKKRIRKKGLPLLEGVTVAFTDIESNYELLASRGILVADPKELKDTAGCKYLKKEDLDALTTKHVSIERIIKEYRGKRSPP